ncbi:MAG: T9SS type A sorting domain-containing protein, partial [Saprospiraceae bacterium]|nr:T9SS type A sorting domain-containing protein [Saprospiraceae bacterium]
AKLQDGMYILAGGMTAGQQVTDQTLLVEVVQVSDTEATVAEKESVFYPNPSGGVFTLQKAGTYTVECRSVKGTVLRRLTLSAGDQIDCTDLPAGPYLLQLWQEGVLKSSERVIIQR